MVLEGVDTVVTISGILEEMERTVIFLGRDVLRFFGGQSKVE